MTIDKVSSVRKALGLNDETIYMNTGMAGLLAASARYAIALSALSGYQDAFLASRQAGRAVKESLSRLLNAPAENISLRNSTTHGVVEAINSVNWKAGEEIAISDAEHHAIIRAALELEYRHGVKVRYFSGEGGRVASLSQAITDATRLVAFSHVSYFTGELLPAKELATLARARGVVSVIDGAQSVGAIPVDLGDIDADFYALPGQKWLLGPQGTGALYVSNRILEGYRPDSGGPFPYETERAKSNIDRFETAPPSAIALAGLAASLDWYQNEVGTEWANERIQKIAGYAIDRISQIPGLKVITDPDSHAGLVAAKPEADSEAVLAHLKEKGISARTVAPYGNIRLSLHFFNTESEVDRLALALSEALETAQASPVAAPAV